MGQVSLAKLWTGVLGPYPTFPAAQHMAVKRIQHGVACRG